MTYLRRPCKHFHISFPLTHFEQLQDLIILDSALMICLKVLSMALFIILFDIKDNDLSKEQPFCLKGQHSVKSVRIWSYSGPHFFRIFPHSDWIRRDTESISLYSVRMRENAGKMRIRITPNRDSFYAVWVRKNFCNFQFFVLILSQFKRIN